MRGRLAGLMSLVLVSATAAIVGAPSAYAAPFSDDFNRVDGTSLGDSWSEVIGTDLEIAANALTNPQNTSTFALALFATGNRVTAKVGSTGQGGAGMAKAGLILGIIATVLSVIGFILWITGIANFSYEFNLGG